jgi:hypothetical protein
VFRIFSGEGRSLLRRSTIRLPKRPKIGLPSHSFDVFDGSGSLFYIASSHHRRLSAGSQPLLILKNGHPLRKETVPACAQSTRSVIQSRMFE